MTSAKKPGLCAALGSYIFDYGHKGSADQMRTSWEKLVQYVGTNYGPDIGNEFQNKKTYVIAEPEHALATLARHATRETMVRTAQANLQTARELRHTIFLYHRSCWFGSCPSDYSNLDRFVSVIGFGCGNGGSWPICGFLWRNYYCFAKDSWTALRNLISINKVEKTVNAILSHLSS